MLHINLLKRYLLRIMYVPDTPVVAGNTTVSKTSQVPSTVPLLNL